MNNFSPRNREDVALLEIVRAKLREDNRGELKINHCLQNNQ